MYFVTKQKGEFTYASAAKSVREGTKTRIEYIYLGRVVDLEKGVFYSRERHYFIYDISTGEYSKTPEDYEPPVIKDKRRCERRALDFGDTYLLDQILYKSGLWEIIDKINWDNKDTLHTMTLFYMVSHLPNKDANLWYQGNIVSMIYPKANMSEEGIRDFLEKIGRTDSQIEYHKKYVQFIYDNYSEDENIIVKSKGLFGKYGVLFNQINTHSSKLGVESRLIIVVQKSTGLQLYFHLLPGNINDSIRLKSIFEHCSALEIKIDGCLLDAGYSSDINLDEFYDENHKYINDFIARPKPTESYYKDTLAEILPILENKDNFIKYEDRFLYVKHVTVNIGKDKNQPAHLYIGLDENRLSDKLQKLLIESQKKKLSTDEIYSVMQSQEIFALVSGIEYKTEEILSEYYLRQRIEQLNDISQNYTKLFPIRSHKDETYAGHVALSMIATSVIRFIQLHLNDNDLYLESRIEALRTQKAILYNTKAVPDPPMKPANDMYAAFGIPVPAQLKIDGDRVETQKPDKVKHLFKTPKKRFQKTGTKKSTNTQKGMDDTESTETQKKTESAKTQKKAKSAKAQKKSDDTESAETQKETDDPQTNKSSGL